MGKPGYFSTPHDLLPEGARNPQTFFNLLHPPMTGSLVTVLVVDSLPQSNRRLPPHSHRVLHAPHGRSPCFVPLSHPLAGPVTPSLSPHCAYRCAESCGRLIRVDCELDALELKIDKNVTLPWSPFDCLKTSAVRYPIFLVNLFMLGVYYLVKYWSAATYVRLEYGNVRLKTRMVCRAPIVRRGETKNP